MELQSHYLEISSWNLKGGLSDPARARALADVLINSQADIIVLPDAWRRDSSMTRHPSSRRPVVSPADFASSGYDLHASEYDDGMRPDDDYALYGFGVLVKQTLAHRHRTIGAQRPVHHISTAVGDRPVNVVGMYLSDVNGKKRAAQIDEITQELDAMAEPTLLAGDFNEFHPESTAARCLRSPLARHTLGQVTLGHEVLPRMVGMSAPAALPMLAQMGFKDADRPHRPTAPARLPLFQLDRFFRRGLATTPVLIHPSELSDHLRITTSISVV